MLPTLNRLLLPLLIISLATFHSAYAVNKKGKNPLHQYTVSVASAVPNNPKPLRIDCQSAETDLGSHLLNTGEDFRWSFGIDSSNSTTRYVCYFWWDDKDQRFEVFKYEGVADHKCQNGNPTTCNWIVKPDGFYLGKNKEYDWPVN